MSRMVKVDHGALPAVVPGVSQKVSYTGTSAASTNAVASSCSVVQLTATTNCWVVFAATPVAVANNGASFYLTGGVTYYFGIQPGWKVAAIRDSVSGDLHILEGA